MKDLMKLIPKEVIAELKLSGRPDLLYTVIFPDGTVAKLGITEGGEIIIENVSKK